MNKIRICFIQTNVYNLFNNKTDTCYGGSELQLYLIGKELSKDDKFQVSFIVGNFGQKDIKEIDNIVLYRSFTPKSKDSLIIKLFQAIKYLILLKKINADIYFTSTANSLAGIVSFFCKRNNKKHIHRTAHMMDVDMSFIKSNSILGKIYKYGLEKTDLVITQCYEHKELLKLNHNINSIVIKNGFEIIESKNKVINKQFILWIARYENWKRPELFLKLARIFSEEKFLMICNKKDDKEKEWEVIRDEAVKIINVKFIERISINEIQNYFNMAKIFVNTSVYEGFPNTFVQAGIGKTPILSLSVNPDNFITKYNCGYFCNDDFNVMVDKLKILLKDEYDWKQKSKNVFNYVKENHNKEKNLVILKKKILELCSEYKNNNEI